MTNEITAQDPDTLADLEFSVDWEATYATNKGVRVENAAVYKEYSIIFLTYNLKLKFLPI